MQSPDGPKERELEAAERYERDIDAIDVAEQLADDAVDETLVDIAAQRIRDFEVSL